MQTKIIIGPPGTGKTTTLLNEMQALANVYSPRDIIMCSFTRAAAWEVSNRVEKTIGAPFTVGTIHSFCYRLLGLSPECMMSPKRWEQFASDYNIPIRQSFILGGSEPKSNAEKALACISFIENHDKDVLEWPVIKTGMLPHYPEAGLDYVKRTYKQLQEFKQHNGLLDFNDLLKLVLEEKIMLEGKVLCVDEAQDLSARQWKVIDMWAPKFEQIIIAGDDDQAVYEWSGAAPEILIKKANQHGYTVLNKSYRIPGNVLKLCQWVIGHVSRRVRKDFQAAKEGGIVKRVPGEFRESILDKLYDKQVRLLVRSNWQMDAWRELLTKHNIPWQIESAGRYGSSYWGNPDLAGALAAIKCLIEEKTPPKGDLLALLKYIPANHRLAPWGVKTAVEEGRSVDLTPLFQQAAQDPWGFLVKMSSDEVEKLKEIVVDWKLEEPRWTLSTIHTAKGTEADYVIIDHKLPKQLKGRISFPDSEHRIAYTAASRAREGVFYFDARGYYPY
jgi:superfamily I DNA/RNA helicase